MQPNIDFSKYGITLEERVGKKLIPKTITEEVLKKMQTECGLMGKDLGPVMGVSGQIFSQMIHNRGCRLSESHVTLFFKAYPDISPDKIFNGHKDAILSRSGKLSDITLSPEELARKRQTFLIDMEFFLKLPAHTSFVEMFPLKEQYYFIETGFLLKRWFVLLQKKPDYAGLLAKHFGNIKDIPIIDSIHENHSGGNGKNSTLPETPPKEVGIKKPTSPPKEQISRQTKSKKPALELSLHFFNAIKAGRKTKHLGLGLQTMLGTLMLQLPDWNIVHDAANECVIISKGGESHTASVGKILGYL